MVVPESADLGLLHIEEGNRWLPTASMICDMHSFTILSILIIIADRFIEHAILSTEAISDILGLS